jgi:DNA (cytosine-5)-methyltransferase 1
MNETPQMQSAVHVRCPPAGEAARSPDAPGDGKPLRVAELFAGCGGMAIGLAQAGLAHSVLVERNAAAADTVRNNIRAGAAGMAGWEYVQADVRDIRWSETAPGAHIVAGGPPCQPFSVGGKAAGPLDPRDMWPETIRAVSEIRPLGFLFENVRGLMRPAFSDYLAWVLAALARPSARSRKDLDIRTRLAELERVPEEYVVRAFCVNAADYGAAQKRHRVLIVGYRAELGIAPSLPPPTHSEAALALDQAPGGSYWDRHGLARPGQEPDRRTLAFLQRQRASGTVPETRPWRTCRDAFQGLGEPSEEGTVPNHRLQPGARAYPGHTGSPMDEPAKALKAGDHGVPGGENMLRRTDGSVRYFTVREAARLQGLPDDYLFRCTWSDAMRQLGNAVPTQLACAFGTNIRKDLHEAAPGGRAGR